MESRSDRASDAVAVVVVAAELAAVASFAGIAPADRECYGWVASSFALMDVVVAAAVSSSVLVVVVEASFGLAVEPSLGPVVVPSSVLVAAFPKQMAVKIKKMHQQ